MFIKKDTSMYEFDTLIGANTVFEGSIESQGTVRVDGKVKGDLKTSGDVIVGNTGLITGNIYAENVNLSGTVEGNVNSKGVLRILSTAKLYGDIFVKSFVTDEGAIFQGKCNMIESSSISENSDKNYKKGSMLKEAENEQTQG